MLLNVMTKAKKMGDKYIISHQVTQFHSPMLLASVALCFMVCFLPSKAAKSFYLCFLLTKSGENILNWRFLSLQS